VLYDRLCEIGRIPLQRFFRAERGFLARVTVAAAAITFFASGEGAIVAGPKNGGPSMSTGDEPGIATRSEA